MGYKGEIIGIPVGADGLRLDDPESKLTAGSLIRALNITMVNGMIEKDYGSARWNQTILPTGVKGAIDWWPEDETQRMIALGADGKVYRFTDAFVPATEVAATIPAPKTLNSTEYANFVTAGAEVTGNPRKLFLFTGYDQVQVISGDGIVRTNISAPPGDWAGLNYPVDGVIHQGRLFVFLRRGSTVFASLSTDHEDFTTLPLPYEVYPGESEYIAQHFVFRGKYFVLKYPTGLYVLNDTDPDASNWFFTKINSDIGARSPRGRVAIFDDVLFGNDYGSITSLTATDQLGDVISADIFAQLRCQSFIRDNINPDIGGGQHAIYYKDKKLAMFSFKSKTSSQPDRICYLDFQVRGQPRAIWIDKDQPNCLFLRKDLTKVERPFYGSSDGYIYAMDSHDRFVGGNPYRGEFWLPHYDLGAGDVTRAKANKNFDFLEVVFNPSGDMFLNIDYFIDGKYIDTVQANLSGDSDLDRFKLDSDNTDAEAEKNVVIPINGSGRRISFRCYNTNGGENFSIVEMRVWFSRSGEQAERGIG